MDKQDKTSTENKLKHQLVSPLSLMNPTLYYNSVFTNGIFLSSHPSPIFPPQQFNPPFQISLITILNSISLLQSKRKNKESKNTSDTISETSYKKDSSNYDFLGQKTKRSQKICDACPHKFSPHYAKGMCSNCYHSRGRRKKPWNCPHSNKFHYAHGLCQNCYQMRYMKKINESGVDEENN